MLSAFSPGSVRLFPLFRRGARAEVEYRPRPRMPPSDGEGPPFSFQTFLIEAVTMPCVSRRSTALRFFSSSVASGGSIPADARSALLSACCLYFSISRRAQACAAESHGDGRRAFIMRAAMMAYHYGEALDTRSANRAASGTHIKASLLKRWPVARSITVMAAGYSLKALHCDTRAAKAESPGLASFWRAMPADRSSSSSQEDAKHDAGNVKQKHSMMMQHCCHDSMPYMRGVEEIHF